jgi:hypothetical protein
MGKLLWMIREQCDLAFGVGAVQGKGAAGWLQPQRGARETDSPVPRAWFRRRNRRGETRNRPNSGRRGPAL